MYPTDNRTQLDKLVYEVNRYLMDSSNLHNKDLDYHYDYNSQYHMDSKNQPDTGSFRSKYTYRENTSSRNRMKTTMFLLGSMSR